jgi:hypothetical protein
MTKKHTLEYIQTYFKEQECELLETEYINSKTKMKYICKCKKESEITWDNFKKGKRCMKCGGREKLTYENVYNYFKEQECELLETEYINNRTKMKYICKCNNESEITFNDFKDQNKRCRKCGGNEKYTYEYVKNYFIEQKCKLLSTIYTGANDELRYICVCKKESIISFSKFINGVRCCLMKDYIMPSNTIRRIQGYEHLALDELIKNNIKEDDIVTKRKEMPIINYYYILDKKNHRYFPDIWIKSENKIIEVKSAWIYKKDLVKNIMKALATRKLGYDFEFWIYTKEAKNTYSKIII